MTDLPERWKDRARGRAWHATPGHPEPGVGLGRADETAEGPQGVRVMTTNAELIAVLIESAPLRPFDGVRAWPDGPMDRGRCYVNAVEVADRHGMPVVLGTAIGPSALRPTEDAWVVDDAGTPWEVTWSAPGTDDRGCPMDSIPPCYEVLTLANVAFVANSV
jgi:hypothetical protein